MEITITRTIQETHQLDLPAYRKNSCYFYKIISEKQAVQICIANGSESIGIAYTSSALSLAPLESSQEEFDTKFNEVVTILMEKAS